MSDIPQARQILERLLQAGRVDPPTKREIRRALSLMIREKNYRRAPAKKKPINKHIRARIRMLVHNSDMTMHEIANVVGLRSGGRVSEVIHGKR